MRVEGVRLGGGLVGTWDAAKPLSFLPLSLLLLGVE